MKYGTVTILILFLLITACTSTPTEPSTIASISTLTPNPSLTPPLPTQTFIPQPSPTFTPSPTPLPTSTSTTTSTPTQTYTPTPTPTVTPTNTPTLTPTPIHPILVLEDDFETDTMGWAMSQGVEGLQGSKLILYGPPDDQNPDSYYAHRSSPSHLFVAPADSTFEFVFDRPVSFTGPCLSSIETYYCFIITSDGGLGLLRPDYEENPWDSLGQARYDKNGGLVLQLIFVGDQLTVWANGTKIASRRLDLFLESKQFKGFRVGEGDKVGVDSLRVYASDSQAVSVVPTKPQPAETSNADGFDCQNCDPAAVAEALTYPLLERNDAAAAIYTPEFLDSIVGVESHMVYIKDITANADTIVVKVISVDAVQKYEDLIIAKVTLDIGQGHTSPAGFYLNYATSSKEGDFPKSQSGVIR